MPNYNVRHCDGQTTLVEDVVDKKAACDVVMAEHSDCLIITVEEAP